MGRPRAFDYELLKQLVFDHPDWSDRDFARELTLRQRQDNPKAAEVKVGTVSSTLSRQRDTWEKNAGREIPSRLVPLADFMPPHNTIHAEHRNDTDIRYLREVAKHARGDRPAEDWKVQFRNQALNWMDGLKASGQLLDLDPKGVPFRRFATAGERNEDGSSKAVAAWLLPGWHSPPQQRR